MNDTKQHLLLEYLISSVDVYSLTRTLIKSSYFEPNLRRGVEWINDYNNKYNALPSTDQIYAETELDLRTHELTSDQTKYW